MVENNLEVNLIKSIILNLFYFLSKENLKIVKNLNIEKLSVIFLYLIFAQEIKRIYRKKAKKNFRFNNDN